MARGVQYFFILHGIHKPWHWDSSQNLEVWWGISWWGFKNHRLPYWERETKLSKVLSSQSRKYLACFIFGSSFCCTGNVVIRFCESLLTPVARAPSIRKPTSPEGKKAGNHHEWRQTKYWYTFKQCDGTMSMEREHTACVLAPQTQHAVHLDSGQIRSTYLWFQMTDWRNTISSSNLRKKMILASFRFFHSRSR